MAWTKRAAIAELKSLIEDARAVASQGRSSPEFTKWYLRASNSLEEIFGGSSNLALAFASLPFHETGTIFTRAFNIQGALDQRHHKAFCEDLDRSIGVFEAGLHELSRKSISEVYHGKNTPKESSTLIRVLSLVEHKLRKTIRDTPKKEKQIQDAIENLLIGADIPYQREHPHIAYSSKKYVPDFSFDRIDLALEVKLCAKGGREKEMIAEMNDDIMAYKTMFGNIAFVIYDVGMIRDVEKFTSEFSQRDDVLIRVVKH